MKIEKSRSNFLKKGGFTLFETLIYAVLISIVIGMVLIAVYEIIEARYRSLARVEIEEETNFLMRKIVWVLSGVSSINGPPLGVTSTTLSVNKVNFSQNPVVVGSVNHKAAIAYGGGLPVILSSDSVRIGQMSFTQIGSAATPGIEVHLSLEFVPRGQLTIYNASTSITTAIYVRQ